MRRLNSLLPGENPQGPTSGLPLFLTGARARLQVGRYAGLQGHWGLQAHTSNISIDGTADPQVMLSPGCFHWTVLLQLPKRTGASRIFEDSTF
jgi:hypothetical protein